MKQVHKGDIEPTKEWEKFKVYIDKMKAREQKDTERVAAKLNQDWKVKYEKLLEEHMELQKAHEELKDKYFKKYDSDYSGDED
jgi:type II secretory pathway predicted ATPase ExeA